VLAAWLQVAKLWNLALEIRRSTPAVDAGCSHCAKTVKSHCMVVSHGQPPRASNGSDQCLTGRAAAAYRGRASCSA